MEAEHIGIGGNTGDVGTGGSAATRYPPHDRRWPQPARVPSAGGGDPDTQGDMVWLGKVSVTRQRD